MSARRAGACVASTLPADAAAERADDAVPVPVCFDGCFGWLHGAPGGVGVVLCAGAGGDARSGHGLLRVLAERLARAGYPTLRFDYPGTGDSADAADAVPPRAWLGSVEAATAALRAATGARQVVLGGLRLGGTLAALAAARCRDVAALILLDPVVSGESFVRELRLAARLVWDAPGQEKGWLEADGLRSSDAALGFLGGLDLLALPAAPARRVLVLDSSGRPSAAALVERLRALGADATRAAFGRERVSDRDVGPGEDLARVVEWLRGAVPPGPVIGRPVPRPAGAVLRLEGCTEEALRFGPARRLAGILCRPSAARNNGLALVIGNIGGFPHHGYGGFHVRLARRLATMGIASLRFDFSGLGDSPPAGDDPGAQVHLYGTDRRADAAAAIDLLQRLGYRRFALGGICSGAFHALHAALADRRVGGLLMVNPVTFEWREGDTIERLWERRRSARSYVSGLRRGASWRRLLRGEVEVGTAARVLRRYALGRAAAAVLPVAERVGLRAGASFPRRAMRELSARGVRVQIVIGHREGGLNMLEEHFGSGARRLRALPGVEMTVQPGLDHSVTRTFMQDGVADAALRFLRGLADRGDAPPGSAGPGAAGPGSAGPGSAGEDARPTPPSR